MATMRQKLRAEQNARALLEDHGLPQPDEVEYGHTCVRLLWHEEKLCMIVQIDEPPPGFVFAEDLPRGIAKLPLDGAPKHPYEENDAY